MRHYDARLPPAERNIDDITARYTQCAKMAYYCVIKECCQFSRVEDGAERGGATDVLWLKKSIWFWKSKRPAGTQPIPGPSV